MSLAILKKLDFSPSQEEIKEIKKNLTLLLEAVKKEIKRQRLDADVFVGGSYAKGTLVKKERYDVDVFVRFAWKYEDISAKLEKIIKSVSDNLGFEFKIIHGSRDYFSLGKRNIEFELIPVTRIKKPKEMRNVTDLSYFHVNYVRNKVNSKMAREIVLAKKFCESAGVYGAESYINGFSGYGLECLIIYYKSLEKMLRVLSKVKDRIVIDSEKKFKKKDDVFFEINEAKLHSPIILVDPTWKERNALAALSVESFRKFQNYAKKFLEKPMEKYFEVKQINEDKMEQTAKKKKAEFLHIRLTTDRQKGDIAGTKMKKFYEFLNKEIEKYYLILFKEFDYKGEQEAEVYLGLKSKKEIIKIGPEVSSASKWIENFKEVNSNIFAKNGRLYSRVRIDFTGKEFVEKWTREQGVRAFEMGITGIKIIN